MSDITNIKESTGTTTLPEALATLLSRPKETSQVSAGTKVSQSPVLKRSFGGQKKKPIVKKKAVVATPKVSPPAKEVAPSPSIRLAEQGSSKEEVQVNAPIPSPVGSGLSTLPNDPPTKENVLPQGGRPDRSKPMRVKFADRNRVSYNNMDPDYMYRLVNDKDGRIERLQQIGYELVQSDEHIGDYRVAEGSKMGSAVSKPVGNGTTGYLMKIRKEFYMEDRKAKDEVIAHSERAMKPDKSKNETGPGLTNE